MNDFITEKTPPDIKHFLCFPYFLLDERYASLSNDAKLLYALMLDRAKLSRKNGLADNLGHVFIYFTIAETKSVLHCGLNRAVKIHEELERANLILRKRYGQGKPIKVFPKFSTDFSTESKFEFSTTRNANSRLLKCKSLEF